MKNTTKTYCLEHNGNIYSDNYKDIPVVYSNIVAEIGNKKHIVNYIEKCKDCIFNEIKDDIIINIDKKIENDIEPSLDELCFLLCYGDIVKYKDIIIKQEAFFYRARKDQRLIDERIGKLLIPYLRDQKIDEILK